MSKINKKNLTKKTKAIISVSVYGLPPNYDQILKICRDNKLFLIEDNAECFLGKYNKKKLVVLAISLLLAFKHQNT